MSILKFNNLNKSFGGVKAVNGLSISIEPGKITSIIGPNGSGKTTLMNLISGVVPWDSGTIAINGVDFEKIDSSELPIYGITRTFQNVRLFEQVSVLDNILVVLTDRNVFGSIFEKHGTFHLQKAENVLKRIGLWEKRNELVSGLSYGQRKLLEVARVLAMDSQIVLFDEPFAGLFKEMITFTFECFWYPRPAKDLLIH